MNSAKLLAFLWSGLTIGLSILQGVAPILPPAWGNLVTALLGVLALYHIHASHSPVSLGAAGYVKKV